MRLPDKSHFKKDGIFSQTNLRYKKPIPVEILNFVFPNYLLYRSMRRKERSKKKLEKILEYCIYLQKLAKKEEREHRQAEKIKQEEELKKWEEELSSTVQKITQKIFDCCRMEYLSTFKYLDSLKNVSLE